MQWTQNYAALGDNIVLTAFVVAIPIFFLIWALAFKRMKGHIAGLLTLLIALVTVILVYKMPFTAAISATLLGMVNGLFPIGWIIIAAVFLYNLTVKSGKFDIVKSSISSISDDRRIQALVIAFCFSSFLEGVAGQGAPVAIAAAMLIGLGFNPLKAAVISLVANVPPVPFGPVGTPTIMMSSVTGIDEKVISHAVGTQVTFISIIIPIFMLFVMVGWKKTVEVLPAALVAGIGFAIPFYFITKYMGPILPSIISSVISLLALAAFTRVWKPKTIYRFPDEKETTSGEQKKYSAGEIIHAWSPFYILMGVMTVWGTPSFKNWVLNDLKWFVSIDNWPGLGGVVYKAAPIVKQAEVYAAGYRWDYFSAAGTALMLTAIVSIFILRIKPGTAVKVLGETVNQLKFSLITIASVLGLAYLSNYSGLSFTLGLAFVETGKIFIIFSPILGWLGVFLTGSVTSSAALFGKMQQVTAEYLQLNPLLTISANMTGAIMGKLISPQSIAVAAGAVGLAGRENEIFRQTIKYSLMLVALVIVIILIQAYLLPGTLPKI
ncbi:lactate permease [Bacillus sp. FJAT-27225]|uniref:L-lactate permease n=1 Tax=Bacillus sp. FJAT-27225 TaxID=1743144 RepID=UPI00080C31F3|nr:lactate permease LctP family transporter [Bacillus sp. FJAT-27225]OCA88682.1 lactate permease [Bacillus sp. FJAT-27225]